MCDIPLTSVLGWTVVWFFTAVELESAAVMRSTESVQYVFGFPDPAQGLCLCVFLCVFVCLPRASALQCITSALVDLPCGLDTLFLSLCLSLPLSLSHTHTHTHLHRHTCCLHAGHTYVSSGTKAYMSPTVMSLCQMQSKSSTVQKHLIKIFFSRNQPG